MLSEYRKDKSIPELEAQVLKHWKENKVFEKSVEQNSEEDLYVFYDGPPFISGLPHYGHLLGSIAKDVIPRYWTMKGKRVERVWGWDAHGLTVENKVQKKLGIKNRRDIEKYGLEEFTKACYEYTSETSAEWDWYVDKIARWVDIKNAYRTTDQSYMESVMWAFKELFDKGLIYEGVYTSMYCPTCGTPVSNFEVGMDNSYREFEDPAVTIKFKIINNEKFKDVYVLAWTTTPWTLPSNRALVVDKDADYIVFELENTKYICAKAREEEVLKNLDYKIINTIKGEALVGLEYEPLFKFFKNNNKDFKIYTFENMVTMDEGTGIVHSAPGFGEIDSKMGKHFGLTMMLTLDDEGKFIPGNNEENLYEGEFYTKANPKIMQNLHERDLVFKESTITHRIPFHDRCDTNLIYRAQNSWFVNIEALREKLLKEAENINWVPKNTKQRFEKIIEQAPDWCISRARFWATPMPVWKSEDGDMIIVSSIKELEELSGQKVTDLHRPYIDEITIVKNGKEYKRIPEVMDSWFEAGSMPYAQIHYPFENKEKFEKNFPGDYIVEYIAQVRAWFNVMHVLSTSLFGKNSFRNVICTGVLAGTDGRKMSKTFGNYPDPKEILEKFGGDALRLYLMNTPLMVGENASFDNDDLKTMSRNILNPLWNSLKYFLIYADEYKWDESKLEESQDTLDQWILARLSEFIKTFSNNIEAYTVPPAVKDFGVFIDDLSRWYVRRARDRISSGDMSAISTLYIVLDKLSKAVAPLVPFMSESIYQELQKFSHQKQPESVHLCKYPETSELTKDQLDLIKNMQYTRDIVSEALAIRVEAGIKVRQPVQTVSVVSNNPDLEFYDDLIKAEVNVKEVNTVLPEKDTPVKELKETKVYLDIELSTELKVEGHSRDLIRSIQGMRKKQGLSVADRINIIIEDIPENKLVLEKFKQDIVQKTGAKNITLGNETAVEKA